MMLNLITNEISFGSDIHGVPVEGDVGRPVGESFMMFTRQNYVSENMDQNE